MRLTGREDPSRGDGVSRILFQSRLEVFQESFIVLSELLFVLTGSRLKILKQGNRGADSSGRGSRVPAQVVRTASKTESGDLVTTDDFIRLASQVDVVGMR